MTGKNGERNQKREGERLLTMGKKERSKNHTGSLLV